MIKYIEKEIKGLDEEKGIVEFYASSFNRKDSDSDIIEKGAYTKTIKENQQRIKHLLNHERSVGVVKELHEDTFGLYVISQLILKKQIGREIFEEYKVYASLNKSMEHSVRISDIKGFQDDARDARIIKEVSLFDVTTMETWGANEFTPQQVIKKFKNIDDAVVVLELMLKGKYQDNKLKNIEEALNKLKSLIDEPVITTQKTNEPIDINVIMNNSCLFKI